MSINLTKEEVAALSTGEIIDKYNTVVKANPELGLNEVTRFSDRKVAETRLLGLGVRLKAIMMEDEPVPKKPKKGKKTPRVRKERVTRPASDRAPRVLKDVRVEPHGKIYPPRDGSKQAFMLGLISRASGISVEDFCEKMNAEKKWEEYNPSRAWSSLIFNLHSKKGYGIERKGGRIYVVTKG